MDQSATARARATITTIRSPLLAHSLYIFALRSSFPAPFLVEFKPYGVCYNTREILGLKNKQFSTMGTLLGKMLSSLKIKRDKYSTYREKLKEIEKFEDQQKEKPLANKTKRQREPEKNRKNLFNRRTSNKKVE